jgi:hypothetical protein
LSDALAHLREPWVAEITAGNLSLLADARSQQGGAATIFPPKPEAPFTDCFFTDAY